MKKYGWWIVGGVALIVVVYVIPEWKKLSSVLGVANRQTANLDKLGAITGKVSGLAGGLLDKLGDSWGVDVRADQNGEVPFP